MRDLARSVRLLLDRPFAFYGHSNGALVAFELARLLSRCGGRDASALFLAAKRSPLLPAETPVCHLPDAEFVEVLRRYGGTPAGLFACPDLLSVYLPILRADFALGETHALTDRSPVRIPVHAIAGREDTLATPNDMRAWLPLASGEFVLHQLSGAHFFLATHAVEVGHVIDRALLRSRPDSPIQGWTRCPRKSSLP